MNQDLSVAERLTAPTPKFFRRVRAIGIALGAIGAAVLAAPIALPVMMTTIAGYLATAGAVATAVSSTTVDWEALKHERALDGFVAKTQ